MLFIFKEANSKRMETCVLHMRGDHVPGRRCLCPILRWQLAGLGHQLNTDQERNPTSQGRIRHEPLKHLYSHSLINFDIKYQINKIKSNF